MRPVSPHAFARWQEQNKIGGMLTAQPPISSLYPGTSPGTRRHLRTLAKLLVPDLDAVTPAVGHWKGCVGFESYLAPTAVAHHALGLAAGDADVGEQPVIHPLQLLDVPPLALPLHDCASNRLDDVERRCDQAASVR